MAALQGSNAGVFSSSVNGPISLPTPTGTPRGESGSMLPNNIMGMQGALPTSGPAGQGTPRSSDGLWSPLDGVIPEPEPVQAAPAPGAYQPPAPAAGNYYQPPAGYVPPGGAPPVNSAAPVAQPYGTAPAPVAQPSAYTPAGAQYQQPTAPAPGGYQPAPTPAGTQYQQPGAAPVGYQPAPAPAPAAQYQPPQRPIANFSNPNASGEDMVRAQVLTLFSRCDNDVEKTIEVFARTLRESGRHDIRVESDPKGAIMTVSQDLRHATGAKSTDFVQKLNAISERHEKELAPVRALAQGYPPGFIPGQQQHQPTQSDQYQVADLSRYHQQPKDTQTDKKLPRSFKLTKGDLKRRAFPTSNYNGNYLLQRYGGCFPDHGNYGFYRQYGAKGRGAATAEHHNYPGGLPPQPTSLYQ